MNWNPEPQKALGRQVWWQKLYGTWGTLDPHDLFSTVGQMTNPQSYADKALCLTPLGSRLQQPPVLSSYTFWSRPWPEGRLEASPSKQPMVGPELGHPLSGGSGLLACSPRAKGSCGTMCRGRTSAQWWPRVQGL